MVIPASWWCGGHRPPAGLTGSLRRGRGPRGRGFGERGLGASVPGTGRACLRVRGTCAARLGAARGSVPGHHRWRGPGSGGSCGVGSLGSVGGGRGSYRGGSRLDRAAGGWARRGDDGCRRDDRERRGRGNGRGGCGSHRGRGDRWPGYLDGGRGNGPGGTAGNDQHRDRATGHHQAARDRDRLEPSELSPGALGSGPATQVLPGIGISLQRDRGGRPRYLDLRRTGRHPGWCGVRPHPITQGAQLLDRQDLVSIRLAHNVV